MNEDQARLIKEYQRTGGQKFTAELVEGYHRIIENDQAIPYVRRIFTSNVEELSILYPFDSYFLEANDLKALASAMETIDEENFQIVNTPTGFFPLIENFYWSASTKKLNDYPQKGAFYRYDTNCLFSETGRWGILITDSEFAFLGGPKKFIKEFHSSRGVTEEEIVKKFLHDHRDNQHWAKHIVGVALGKG